MSNFPDSVGTPSTQFGGYIEEPPKWPKVVGIISIVFGSLGLFCNVCGLLGGAMQGAMQNMAANNPQMQQQMAMQPSTPPIMYVMHFLGVALGVFLVVAGIMLLKRNSKARMMHIAWAVLAIIIGVTSMVISFQVTDQMMADMEQQAAASSDPNQAAAMRQMMPTMRAGALAGVVVGALISLAWPVFCLIWFLAIKKRPEDMGPAPADVL